MAGAFTTVTAGCSGLSATGSTTTDNPTPPAEDPFPDSIESGQRGGAETTVIRTIEDDVDYADASIECAKAAHEAVWEHVKDHIDETEHVGYGYGRGPKDWDGMAVHMSLTTATYGRDRELIREADLEFETLVSVTPPIAYVNNEDGTRICTVSVYATQREAHID